MSEKRDLMGRLAGLADQIDPGLTDREVDRLIDRSQRRARRKRVQRAALALLLCGLGAGALARLHRSPSVAPPAMSNGGGGAAGQSRVLRVADGSSIQPLDATSELVVTEDSPRAVTVAVRRGGGRFDVAPDAQRRFTVRAAGVTVTVTGTRFTVEQVADRVGVSVERGTVLVDWTLATRSLHAGESAWFPPLVVGDVEGAGGARSEPVAHPAKPRGPDRQSKSAEELLAEADAARLAGQPDRAVALLRRLLAEHARDRRAPLAAFTLGRMLLMELDRPREAAEAFARVRVLPGGGAFAEDALAREVEAWKKAGDLDRARARAQEYLRIFPQGRRADTMRDLGGIE